MSRNELRMLGDLLNFPVCQIDHINYYYLMGMSACFSTKGITTTRVFLMIIAYTLQEHGG
jgi:hypothetical protein